MFSQSKPRFPLLTSGREHVLAQRVALTERDFHFELHH